MSSQPQGLEKPIQNLLVDLDGTILGNRNLPLALDFSRQAVGELSNYIGLRQAASLLLRAQNQFNKPSTELTNDLRFLAVMAKGLNLTIEETRRIVRES